MKECQELAIKQACARRGSLNFHQLIFRHFGVLRAIFKADFYYEFT